MNRSRNLIDALRARNFFPLPAPLRRAGRAVRAGSRALGRAVLDLAAPEHCRHCQAPLGGSPPPLCPDCARGIAWTASACLRCGYPVAAPAPWAQATAAPGTEVEAAPGAEAKAEAKDEGDSPDAPAPVSPADRLLASLPLPCSVCASLAPAFDLAAAGGSHDGALRAAVLRFKFQGDGAVLPILEEALHRAARSPALGPLLALRPAVVPVPLHWAKRWWRGRDPVLELARRFVAGCPEAQAQGLEALPLLVKSRWTLAQSRLSRASRRRNLRRAFLHRPPRRLRERPCPEVVLLIDDVLTTGATASACAEALKRAGARLVGVLAATRSL